MARSGFLAAAVAGCLLAAACGGDVSGPAGADAVTALVDRVEAHRAVIGCPSLEWHGVLREVAASHSEDMVRRGYFSHVNPEGETPFDRMREAGLRWTGGAAENLAAGQRTGARVFEAWLQSPSHRRALEDCSFTHHAVGQVEGYWTHLFLADPVQ